VSASVTHRPTNVANFRAFFSKSVVIVGIFLKATALGDMRLHENPTHSYFLFKGIFWPFCVKKWTKEIYMKRKRERKIKITLFFFLRSKFILGKRLAFG